MAVRYIDRDLGWNQVKRELRKSLRKPHTVVGIFGTNASANHANTSLSNVQVAAVHEFGLNEIPERSFIRGTVDARQRNIAKMQRQVALAVLDRRMTTRQALDALGLYVKGQIQDRIARGIPPPNAPSTIRRKGSSTPLIHTGQLRGSIDHEARNA